MNKLNLKKAKRIKTSNGEVLKLKVGNFLWQRQTMDDSTLAVVNYANTNGYALPSNITAFDNLIKGMKSCGIWALLDRFWLFSGDGSTDFKRINLINPSKTKADFYGGLIISNSGIQGNGINAYVNTNFNPALLESGQKFQLNDASFGVIIANASPDDVGTYGVNRSDHNDFNNTWGNVVRLNSHSDNYVYSSPVTGLNINSRTNGTNVDLIRKNSSTNKDLNSYSIQSKSAIVFAQLNFTYFTNNTHSCFFMGASIPFQVSQDFRTVFNTYLSAIGQTPIA